MIKEYSEIMLQEEEFWALKPCLNQAAFRDRNTAFFHVSTLVRRHRNRIKSIKNSLGEWVTEEEEVKNIILQGFIEPFQIDRLFSNCSSDVENFSYCFLSEEERECLSNQVLEEEIKCGLWALKPFKAPGIDGLHAGFYQYCWSNVKELVCQEVTNIFETREMPEYLNETLICLIPKCQSLESLSNYRPISLCNSIYKVVTKILIGRIIPFLDRLVSPVQSTFVPGRRGLDNILIA